MSHQLVLKFAQEGRPDAIETLMNAALHSQGITARVIQEGNRLFAFLESTHALNQAMIANFIGNGIARLDVKSIRQVDIVSYCVGNHSPAWECSIDLAALPLPLVSQTIEASLSLQPDLVADLIQLPAANPPAFPRQWSLNLLRKAPLFLLPAAIAAVYAFQPNSVPSDSEIATAARVFTAPAETFAPLQKMTEIGEATRAHLSAATLIQRAMDTAEGAATLSKSARSGADWNLIAQRWHEAMHLMKAVPLSDLSWEAAQLKAGDYEDQRDEALDRAKELGAIAAVPAASPQLDVPPAVSAVVPSISQANFEQLEFGDSYHKVAAILGSPGQGLSWSTRVIYRWERLDGAFLEAKFEGDKLVTPPNTWSPDAIPSLYANIQPGMSLQQIQDRLGAPNQATHSVSLMYRWQSEENGTLEATFVDDRLIYKSWSE